MFCWTLIFLQSRLVPHSEHSLCSTVSFGSRTTSHRTWQSGNYGHKGITYRETTHIHTHTYIYIYIYIYIYTHTVCRTRYLTRHFFNNSNTHEDTATKFEEEYARCVRNEEDCVCSEPNCCDTVKLLKKCRVR